jgi:hypothetical protein
MGLRLMGFGTMFSKYQGVKGHGVWGPGALGTLGFRYHGVWGPWALGTLGFRYHGV